MNDQIKLKNVRLSFPDLFKPKAVKHGDTPKFGASFLLDKTEDAAQIDAVRKLVWQLAKEKFGAKAKALIDTGKLRICLHEGSEKEYEGYGEEVMYITASNSKRPAVVDRNPGVALSEEDGRPYAGCYVNAVLRFWAQDNNFGKRINAQLQGVQFLRDGEPFGAAPLDPKQVFENEAKDEDAEPATDGGGGGSAPDDDDDSIPF